MPPTIRCTRLKSCSFLGNKIKEINDNFFACKELTSVIFDENVLEKIKTTNVKLKKFFVKNNNLKDLNFLKEMKNLNTLDFSFNPIEDFSVLYSDFPELDIVMANNTNTDSLDWIRNKTKLTRLKASDNKIEKIGDLSNNFDLRYLILENNKLAELNDLQDRKFLN